MNRFDSEFSSRSRSVGRWLQTLALTALVAVGLLGSSSIVKAQYSVAMSASANPMCAGSSTTLTATLNGGPINGGYANAALAYAAPYAAGGNEVYLNLDDDEVSDQQQVAEVFRFYGSDIDLNANGFWIGSNGFITFRDDVNATQIVPRNIAAPGNGQTYHTIYIANADMSPQLGGDIWWEVQNDGNGDVLLVTYDGVPLYNSANPLVNSGLLVTVQAVLYLNGHPNAGRIEIRVDLFPDNNIPAAPANKQTVTIGALNNCQPSANVGANGLNQNNPGADINDQTYSWDPAAPAVAASSAQFFYCGTSPCTTGGSSLGTDNTVPFTRVWNAPPSTSNSTHYFRSEITLSNCNVVASASYAVTVNAQPTSQTITRSATSVCEGNSVSYSVNQTISGSTFSWSSTAPLASIVTSGPANENATITFPGGGSNGGTVYTVSATETGPAPTNCSVTSNTTVRIYTVPTGPVTAVPSTFCSGTPIQNLISAPNGYGSYVWSITAGGAYGSLNYTGSGNNVNFFTPNASLTQPTGPQIVTVQVVMTNGGICQTTSTVNITVNPRPADKTITSNNATPCQFDNVTYSVPGFGGNSYAWTASGGGFTYVAPGGYVNGTPTVNLNAVTIQWTTAGPGRDVSVVETSASGCTTTHQFPGTITVNPVPTPVIVGSNTPCQYQAPIPGNPSYETAPNPIHYTYFVNGANPAHGYRWTVTGGQIRSVNGGPDGVQANPFPTAGTFATGVDDIVVRWLNTGAHTVTVTEQSLAGCVGTSVLNVNVTATPTAGQFNMTGAGINLADPCAGTTHNYVFTGAPGASHTITVVGGTISAVGGGGYVIGGGGGQITGGTGNSNFSVNWGFGLQGEISHEYTSGGCAAIETYTIDINPLPSGVISGPDNLCGPFTPFNLSSGNYVVANPTNGPIVGYAWSITNGGALVASTSGAATSIFTVDANNTGSGQVEISVDITNANGCVNTLTRTINVWQTPPAVVVGGGAGPLCAGGTTTWTLTGVPYGTITVYGIFGGSATTPTTFVGAGPHNFTIQWNDQLTPPNAPSFAGGFNVFQYNTNAPIQCGTVSLGTFVNVNARPAAPILATIPPLCINTPTPIPLTVTNSTDINVVYTWGSTGGITLGGATDTPGGGLNENNTITAYGGVGNKSVTVTATRFGCTNATTVNFFVAPVPNPVVTGPNTACQDTTDPIGKPHGSNLFGFTYQYSTPLVAGNTYAWTVSNGYVDAYSTNNGATWTPLAGNVVPANVSTAPITDAHRIRVVFWGTTPGKVKVTETHPGGCAFTTLDYNVNLNTRPNIQAAASTPDICAGDGAQFVIANSQVGYTYRIEISPDGGTTWNVSTAATQAGAGGALLFAVPAADLPYTATAPALTTYQLRATARQNTWQSCGWYRASINTTTNVNPKPAGNRPVEIPAYDKLVCTGEGIDVVIGSNGLPTESWVLYQVQQSPIGLNTWSNTGSPAPGNGTGSITITVPAPAGGVPTLAADNYDYRVLAYGNIAAPPPVISCTTLLADQETARVFALPLDPTVTFTPNPVCWEEYVTVNLANTQEGVQYEVNINGSSLSPAVFINGNGGNASAIVNSAEFYATNPVGLGSVVVNNVQVTARISQYGAYTRPVPPSQCAQNFGTTNLTVLEKPVAEITGPDTVCGPSTSDYYATPVTPAPGTYDWLITNTPQSAPAGTNPLAANNTGANTVNPYTVNWGVNLLSCDGSYNPLTTTIRMIATNANNCTDTALKVVTINPTVHDAEVVGDNQACIYGGFEDHLETYSVERPGNCVFPVGTEFLWSMPTGTVSGAIRSGQGTPTIVGEWYTTGGTGIGTVSVTVTLPATHGGCATTRTLDVNVYPLPQPVINGPDDVCQNEAGTVYEADNFPNDTYLWEVLGGQIVGGSGNGTVGNLSTRTGVGLNIITINWNDEANQNAYVKLTQTSVQGCMNETTFFVTVHPNPVPSIDGPGAVCDNSVVQYSTANNAPANVYNWSVTGNATIQSGTNQATATVAVGGIGGGNSFTLTLKETVVATNCEATVSRVISIYPTPNPTIIRFSPLPGAVGGACLNQEVEYRDTDPVAGSYTYKWTVQNGNLNPATPANGSAIKVTWNTVGTGTVTLMKWHTGTQCTTTVSQDVHITETPAPAISGPTVVCGDETHTYTTAYVNGNTYQWVVTGSATLVSGGTSNEAIVEFTNPATAAGSVANVAVTETNMLSGCFASTNINVTVGYMPQATEITGASPVCNNDTETYSILGEPAGLNYQWAVVGGTIVANNGSSINVKWATVGDHDITVTISTPGTDCKITLEKTVTVEFAPNPAISGDAEVCEGEIETYSTPYNPGSTYAWNVTGGTITSGQASNVITVEWTTPGAQTVAVTETNASGNCVDNAVLNVTVHATAAADGILRQDGGNVKHACEGYTYTYTTNTPNPGNFEFEWEVTGGQFETPNTGSTVDVKWTLTGNQTLKVTITTPGTDCEVIIEETVAVTPTPQPNIDGATVACINKDHVYQTPYVAGNTYVWEIAPANVFAPITGYPNSNVIEVKWIQPGLHTMTLTETNVAGGCATTVSINVQVNLIPDPFIYTSGAETGYGNPPERRPGIVCNFSTHTYKTDLDATNAGNTFIWTVDGGQIISGQYTNEIEVTWGPAGIGTIAVEETVPGSDCITTVLDSIDIRPTPSPVVTGNINPCVNSIEEYTTPFVAGNSWNWDVTGGTIISGQGTNTIRVRWNTTNWPNTIAGTVKVTEWVTDVLPSMSCINDYTLNTTVRPAPPTPDINGDFEVCATDLNTEPKTDNKTTYFTTPPAQNINVQGVVSYQWSVSNNGEIVGSSNGSSVVVRWYNNGTTPTNGSITIRLTSNFGCTSQSSQTVTINPIPQPDINGPTSVCHNSLQTYSTPGFPGHQYDWAVTGGNVIRSGQGTPNVTVEWTVTGTYTLTVSEINTYGCEVENTIIVTVNELPDATITASGPTTFCQGGDVTLTAPLDYASYVWSTGETARSIVVRTSGEYWVIVTDDKGCSNSSDTITVNVFPSSLPIITVSGPTTFCEGGSVTLTAPAGFDAYLWSTGETTQSITVTESGSYTVTVADNNGCTGTSTEVDVFVNPKPSPVLTVVGSTTVCSGDSVEVRAPLGYVSYTWVSTSGNNYGTERSIFVTQTDTIYCQVVDANGCVGESDTVVITVSPVIDPVITPNGPTEFCEGGSVKLSAPEGFATYFWSNGATTREIVVEDGGDYSVTVTNGAACESASAPTNVMVYALPARPSISRTGDVLKAESAVAEAYQWYRNGVMIPGAVDETLVVNQPGTYRVEIADNNTCSSISDGFDVILTSVDDDVVAGRQALTIFPNPTNGQFTIEGEISVAGNVSIELVNMVGEIVMTQNAFSNGGLFTKSMDMGTLASGVYNVIVTSENERWTIRLVRQ